MSQSHMLYKIFEDFIRPNIFKSLPQGLTDIKVKTDQFSYPGNIVKFWIE